MSKTTDTTTEDRNSSARHAARAIAEADAGLYRRPSPGPTTADIDANPYMQHRTGAGLIIGYQTHIAAGPASPSQRPPREGPPLHPPHKHGVGRLLDLLAGLGIDPPGDAATQFIDACSRAAEAARIPNTVETARRHIEVAVAAGDLDLDEAQRQLAQLPGAGGHAGALAAWRAAKGLGLRKAQDAYRQAWLTIRGHGDLLLDALAATAAEAVSAQLAAPRLDTYLAQRWDDLHETARRLRGWATSDLPNASREEWRFGDPLAVHAWQVQNARGVGLLSTRRVGPHRSVGYHNVYDAPSLTFDVIAAHAQEWQPGVWTAEQVHTHVTAILDGQRPPGEHR